MIDVMENPATPADGILRVGNLVITACVTDSLLAEAYLRYQKENTLSTIFYQSVPTLKDFVDAHLEAGKRVVLGCFRVDDKTKSVEFCGLGWISDPVQMGGFTRAETGVGMFRCAGRDSLQFGKMMLSLFFQQFSVDVIFGYTPEANQLAIRYSQKLGFDIIGPVPDMCVWDGKLAPGWISHLSKSQWQERTRPLPEV